MTLNVKQVEKIIREATPGATADGDGLYLKITPAGSASWQFRYQIAGRRRMMGLGSCTQVSLAQARIEADKNRALVKAGIDPLEKVEAEELEVKAKSVTFKELALLAADPDSLPDVRGVAGEVGRV